VLPAGLRPATTPERLYGRRKGRLWYWDSTGLTRSLPARRTCGFQTEKRQSPTRSARKDPAIFMQQYLVLTALGEYSPRTIEVISRFLRDCGCSIADSRATVLGSEFCLLMMVSGTWDTIAKLEDQLPRMEKETRLGLKWKRTNPRAPAAGQMPYAIDVVCSDRQGVVHDIAKFLTENNIQIQDMYTNTYQAMHTQAPMFSLHMTIAVPTDMSISALRGDFMEFCDRLNLDAIMEPVK
jgi:glycine cleavage system transcriptional repressor